MIREMVGGVHDLQRALCSGEVRVQTQDSQRMDKHSTHIAGRSRMDFQEVLASGPSSLKRPSSLP